MAADNWICQNCENTNPSGQEKCGICGSPRPVAVEPPDWPTLILRGMLAFVMLWHLVRVVLAGTMFDWYYNQMIYETDVFFGSAFFRAFAGVSLVRCVVAQWKLGFAFRENYRSISRALRSLWVIELIGLVYVFAHNADDFFSSGGLEMLIDCLPPIIMLALGIAIDVFGKRLVVIPPKQTILGRKWRDPRKPLVICIGVMCFWHIVRIGLPFMQGPDGFDLMTVIEFAAVVDCAAAIYFLIKGRAYGMGKRTIMIAMYSVAACEVFRISLETIMIINMASTLVAGVAVVLNALVCEVWGDEMHLVFEEDDPYQALQEIYYD